MSKIFLSKCQIKIVESLSQGKKTQEIADTLGINVKSVRQYLYMAYKKTGTHNVRDLMKKIEVAGIDSFKEGQIPHSTPDRRKLMTRLRWRDGDNCVFCGQVIDFRLSKSRDPMHASFYYEFKGSNENTLKLAHNRCNPLVKAPGDKVETVYVNQQSQ